MSNFPVFTTKPPPEKVIGFTIAGTYGPKHPRSGDEWTATYECVNDVPSSAMVDATRVYQVNDSKLVVKASAAAEFIATAVIAGQRDAFRALVRDPDRYVDADALAEIFDMLWGEYTDRPTKPATESEDGQPGTADTSTGD